MIMMVVYCITEF